MICRMMAGPWECTLVVQLHKDGTDPVDHIWHKLRNRSTLHICHMAHTGHMVHIYNNTQGEGMIFHDCIAWAGAVVGAQIVEGILHVGAEAQISFLPMQHTQRSEYDRETV